MHGAVDSLRAQAQIDVALAAEPVVVLVERVVETLVHVEEVEQHNRVADLHAMLDAADVAAHLRVGLIVAERGAEDDDQLVRGHSQRMHDVALEHVEHGVVLGEQEQVAAVGLYVVALDMQSK